MNFMVFSLAPSLTSIDKTQVRLMPPGQTLVRMPAKKPLVGTDWRVLTVDLSTGLSIYLEYFSIDRCFFLPSPYTFYVNTFLLINTYICIYIYMEKHNYALGVVLALAVWTLLV